jgi:hypothetical protein
MKIIIKGIHPGQCLRGFFATSVDEAPTNFIIEGGLLRQR